MSRSILGVAAVAFLFVSVCATSASATSWSWGRKGITFHTPFNRGDRTVFLPRASASSFGTPMPWTRTSSRSYSWTRRPVLRKPIDVAQPKPVAGVPEPGAALLFALGFGAVARVRRSN